jgi:hypothetical protein
MSSKPAGRKAGPRAAARNNAPQRRTPHLLRGKLDIFIEVLARTGSVSQAAEAAGLGRTQVYERRRTHKRFATAWSRALSLGVDSLHDKAMQRAMEGEERAIVRGGEVVATERRVSDGMVKFLLKAHRPEFSGAAPAASASEQEAMANRLKAARERLEAHRAREAKNKGGGS